VIRKKLPSVQAKPAATHIFTILLANEFWLALAIYLDLYNLYAWDEEISVKKLSAPSQLSGIQV